MSHTIQSGAEGDNLADTATFTATCADQSSTAVVQGDSSSVQPGFDGFFQNERGKVYRLCSTKESAVWYTDFARLSTYYRRPSKIEVAMRAMSPTTSGEYVVKAWTDRQHS